MKIIELREKLADYPPDMEVVLKQWTSCYPEFDLHQEFLVCVEDQIIDIFNKCEHCDQVSHERARKNVVVLAS